MTTKFNALRTLAFSINNMIDRGESIPIEEIETNLINKSIIEFIKNKLGNDSMHIYDSIPDYAVKANELLYKIVIGEHNPVQIGNASKKWGIHNNGLVFLNSLVIEVLTYDHFDR